jgi:ABC-type branched-subunit amino acid transport system substrate-binding protein
MSLHRALAIALVPALVACGTRDPNASALPGVDLRNRTVSIGVLNDESGPVAAIGRPWGTGLRILARQINAGGSGVLPEGWRIALVERDHGYDPERAVELYDEIRGQVLFIGTSFGTPNTLPLRSRLERDRLVAFPASLSSKMAEFEFTPPIGPSYRVEVLRALDWIVKQAHGAAKVKLGLVYQQDDYGSDARDAVALAAPQLGFGDVVAQACSGDAAEYTAIVGALKQAGATHVLLATVPGATAALLGVAAQRQYRPVWVGTSPAWLDRFFDDRVVPPAIFQTFHWATSSAYWGEKVPIMGLFLAAYEKYGASVMAPDYYVLAAYAAGMLQMQVLRRAIEGGDLSRDGFLRALHGRGTYETYGATAEGPDYSRVPYATGRKVRVLKPIFETHGWAVVGPYAEPSLADTGPAD